MKKLDHAFAILAYKESPFLEQCILSLKNQTVKSEIFISTSTPTDFLYALSAKYLIPIVVNQENSEIASDWSFAYKNSTTKFVTLAHQDDIYLPEYTEMFLRSAKGRADSLIIFSDYLELIENKKRRFGLKIFVKYLLLTPFLFKRSIGSNLLKRLILSLGTPIQCSTVMFHKERIGPFEFSRDFQCNLDWDAWIRLSQRKGSFIYVCRKLMCHRLHEGTQTYSQIRNKGRIGEEAIIFNRLWPRPVAKLLSGIYALGSKLYHTN